MDRPLKSNDNRFPAPRLLDQSGVAAMLGYSADWFLKNHARLEASGFPRPVLNQDRHSGKRWDSKAINLWLDRQMDPALRQPTPQRPDINDLTAAQKDWEDTLINRAMQFGKGEPANVKNPTL